MLFNVFECFGPKEIFLRGKSATRFEHGTLKSPGLFFIEPSEEMYSFHAVGPTNPTSFAWFHFGALGLALGAVEQPAEVAGRIELLAGTRA